LHASVGHKDDALKYLQMAVENGGTNAVISARIDARFTSLQDDPRFQALLATNSPSTHAPATNAPATHAPATNAPVLKAPLRTPPAGVLIKPPQTD
jgi:hypothetical protein